MIEATHKAAANVDTDFRVAGPEVRGALHAAMQEALFGLSEFDDSIAEGNKALLAWTQAPRCGRRGFDRRAHDAFRSPERPLEVG